MKTDPKERFKELLTELFQLDKTDLDFGIYRILNMRAADVRQFMDEVLPDKLKEVSDALLSQTNVEANAEADAAKAELLKLGVLPGDTDEEIEAKFNQFGKLQTAFTENYEKYRQARSSARDAAATADLERDIYNDLYRFFDRYYEGGDFVTKPRAGDASYMIPYNGEETKFYWANHDQYYIKTGENFKNYVFTNGAGDATRRTVEFCLVEAETEVNNNQSQKKRLFVPADDYFTWDAATGKLTLKFHFKEPTKEEKDVWGERQNRINETLTANILDEQIRATGDVYLIRLWEKERELKNGKKNERQREFYYHLNRYTALNSFDYFIHKDLRKFLWQELDYFLKHEIFSLSFLSVAWSRAQVERAVRQNVIRATVIRDVAAVIIEFLAELENFQKKLYEKKKFVVQSDYCLTLDLLPAGVADEIAAFILSAEGQPQRDEWQTLGFIENTGLTAADLKADGYLVLDTQFLPAELKFKLLDSIENLDEKCGGLLINSDNWQALNFLLAKYKGIVKCVHIDPPYNTKTSGFLYKNEYKHSSWLSMMESRIKLSLALMSDDGSQLCHIDENEYERLSLLYDNFLIPNAGTIVWDKRNPMNAGSGIAMQHEYIIWRARSNKPVYLRNDNVLLMLNAASGIVEKHGANSPSAQKEFTKWVDANEELSGGEKAYRYLDEQGLIYQSVSLRAPEPRTDPKFHQPLFHPITGKPCPVPPNGFSRTPETLRRMIERNEILFGKDETTQPRQKTLLTDETKRQISSVLQDAKKGKADVAPLGIDFPYCHPTSLYEKLIGTTLQPAKEITLDFFAGSATTGHAVINLNREDEGSRKYILIEMGQYFDTVTKPRIQKVIYSADWKDGKPGRNNRPLIETEYRSNGVSHIFQYLKLEQYEDALNNIEFDREREANMPEFEFAERVKYLLRQGVNGSPSLLAVNKFERPFAYKMDIIRLNERVPTTVDLVTTFNFLLGLDVSRIRTATHQDRVYRIIQGVKKKQAYLIVWRDYGEDLDLAAERDWFRQGDWHDADALLYANCDNAFGADSSEAEFQRLMFEDVNLD